MTTYGPTTPPLWLEGPACNHRTYAGRASLPSRFTLGTTNLKITMEVVCEMSLYPSLTAYLARSLSKAQLSLLTPAERLERTRAQQRLSKARIRGHKTFAYPAAPEPTPRDTWRDYLSLDDPSRDILRP